MDFQHRDDGNRRDSVTMTSPKLMKSLDVKIAQAATFRRARETLIASLRSIEEAYASSNSTLHTGRPNCRRCKSKNEQILHAYYEYFLSDDPTGWYTDFPEYADSIEARFRGITNPSSKDLSDLLYILRCHLRKYFIHEACLPDQGDGDGQEEISINTSIPEAAIYENLKALLVRANESATVAFPQAEDAKKLLTQLKDTKNPIERAPFYAQYYCATGPNDTPQQKNFKAKYTRMFEQLVPHDEVIAAMTKEAQESHARQTTALQRQLSSLRLAQSAHLKNKARKAEKDQRMPDRESIPRPVSCSLPGCANEIDPAQNNIECAICEWMNSKDDERLRYFYCSIEHAEEDFDGHDRHEHQCNMGERCLFYPQLGPPDTASAGICSPCLRNHIGLLYFCSSECYKHNQGLHAHEYHYREELKDVFHIELFHPPSDMDLLFPLAEYRRDEMG